ncbi:MAG: TatD family hydrolase [Patescibacteria group bacterium]|nr:TatD family hydrolase [Patescibacteria group bacterium]MDD5121429.1 TatD family hydrolase [Patescibacteria group bacterium]MDD5221885.1 TatD family hydrolase [Patescibacteria group bacterium]MDD5395652.1 TatD family hydrolase [Patescibacteria group bacterium]
MFDVHSHLNFQAFKDDYAEVIKNSQAKGVAKIINIGSNFLTSQKAIQIARQFDGVFAAVGLHPIHVKDESFDLKQYCQLVKNNYDFIKAIGETGLDQHQNNESGIMNYDRQKEVFLRHLELAKEVDLPVILHCRGGKDRPLQAYEDLLLIIDNFGYAPRGELHCFSADWQTAHKFLSCGFYLGFTGIITYPSDFSFAESKDEKSRTRRSSDERRRVAMNNLLEVVAKTPLDRILVETDCPYLSPQPVRRQRCEPWHVRYIIEKIAQIKNTSFEEVEQATMENSEKLFGI